MSHVLIVAATEKSAAMLSDLLCSGGSPRPERIVISISASEARRRMLESKFDLVIINTPLPDELGHGLALDCAHSSTAGVLLLVKNDLADSVSARVEEAGVFVVPKPLSRPLFYQALRLVNAARMRVFGLQKENKKLQQKIDDIRLIDRAKCVLISTLSMTEPQAHAYIEKQAMNRRVTRREIAESILKTYT
ncbi:MAG: ANTAR domain-containing response regulator [Butyricicoccaceae bacterium]